MSNQNKYCGADYETVMRKYADNILRICIVNTNNQEDAKDCFQDVFLKLYTTTKDFSSEEHIKAWLIRVAINQCKDFHKSSWRKRVQLGFDKIPENKLSSQSDFSYSDECEKSIEILRFLSKKYRHILYLYYCEEYSTKEISEILNMSVNTVKSRLLRGRKLLKERWKIYE